MGTADRPKRPEPDVEIVHLARDLREAQAGLSRGRVMRSDGSALVEVVLRGDFYPSRIRIKAAAAGIEADAADALERALKEALRAAVEGAWELSRTAFGSFLPTGGSGHLPQGGTPEGEDEPGLEGLVETPPRPQRRKPAA